MHFSILVITALAAAQSVCGLRGVNYIDKFDQAGLTTPGSGVGSLVDNTAGGALTYNSFSYATFPSVGGAPILTPNTSPNVISGNVERGEMEGQRFWRSMNSTIAYFNEKTIAYACVAGTKPVSCTIQVAGVKRISGNTVVQDLVYNPGTLGTAMATGSFSSDFTELTKVIVTLASAVVPETSLAIVFDTHEYVAVSD